MKEIYLGPTLYDCLEWLFKAGITANFFTVRTAVQKLYCCTLESRIGNKIKTYEIQQHSLKSCLYHIKANHQAIFLELQCPPWTKQSYTI